MSNPRAAVLDTDMTRAFGGDDEPLASVERRLRELFPERSFIVWEGDAQTFEFSEVRGDSMALLGYRDELWLQPGFWAETIVHPDDRRDAIAFCALATGQGSDHVFEYRARARDGQVVWLEDHVKVLFGARGIAARLRGVMFDISEAKQAKHRFDAAPELYRPARETLASSGPTP